MGKRSRMTQAELNIMNLFTWFLINCDDDNLITPADSDWPDWLSKEPVFDGAH